MDDCYQLLVGDAPAGPVRECWEEAAQDAVSAGLAAWALGFRPNGAIQWTDHRAVIVRMNPDTSPWF